jgi:hypothetical protein
VLFHNNVRTRRTLPAAPVAGIQEGLFSVRAEAYPRHRDVPLCSRILRVVLRPIAHVFQNRANRQARERQAEDGKWDNMDAAILALEKEAERLGKMKTWTETIQTNSGKVLEELRKMSAALERQTEVLRESVAALKRT